MVSRASTRAVTGMTWGSGSPAEQPAVGVFMAQKSRAAKLPCLSHTRGIKPRADSNGRGCDATRISCLSCLGLAGTVTHTQSRHCLTCLGAAKDNFGVAQKGRLEACWPVPW